MHKKSLIKIITLKFGNIFGAFFKSRISPIFIYNKCTLTCTFCTYSDIFVAYSKSWRKCFLPWVSRKGKKTFLSTFHWNSVKFSSSIQTRTSKLVSYRQQVNPEHMNSWLRWNYFNILSLKTPDVYLYRSIALAPRRGTQSFPKNIISEGIIRGHIFRGQDPRSKIKEFAVSWQSGNIWKA